MLLGFVHSKIDTKPTLPKKTFSNYLATFGWYFFDFFSLFFV